MALRLLVDEAGGARFEVGALPGAADAPLPVALAATPVSLRSSHSA